LKALRTWAPSRPAQFNQLCLWNAADAAALLAACPSLHTATVDVRGTPTDVAAALSALPGPGPKRVRFDGNYTFNHPQLLELREWLPAAISAADVTDLYLPPGNWVSVGDHAVASLVLALVGLQRLGLQQQPNSPESLLGHLCRTLTVESPLTELALHGSDSNEAGLPDLAALIAHSQSRLRTLSLSQYRIANGGCDCPLSAALYGGQSR
jgi:hypothetical protein